MTSLSAATGDVGMPRDFPAAERAALFLDVDGTLLDLAPEPMDVVADTNLRQLLSVARDRVDGALAIVSGRAIHDIDRIFAPLKFTASGLHGSEMRLPDGSMRVPSPRAMDHARASVVRFVADNPGLLIEDKGATLAVHYRKRPELASRVLDFMRGFAPRDDVAIQEGKLVVELKPVGFDKGTAISALLKCAPFVGRTPFFAGDDLSDEHGFAAVNAHGGISMRIGPADELTAAGATLPNPAALRALLAMFVATNRPRDAR